MTIFGKAARVGTLSAVVVCLGVSGCGGTASKRPVATTAPSAAAVATTAAVEPRTVEAAQTAAQKTFESYAAGDWAGFWDTFAKTGKKAISRDGYVRLQTTCKAITGVPFEITRVRLEGPDGAVVLLKRAGFSYSHAMKYEDGVWRFQPDADAMAEYAKGVDGAIAARRAKHQCG